MKISDEVVNVLIMQFENMRSMRFEIGDYLIEIVKQHDGQKKEVLNYLAGAVGVAASTLYDYYRVAETWEPKYREMYQSLDWTIYRNTNPTDPADIGLLEQVIDGGWNATRLKEEKYGKNTVTEDIDILISIAKRLGGKLPDIGRKKQIIEQIINLLAELAKEE